MSGTIIMGLVMVLGAITVVADVGLCLVQGTGEEGDSFLCSRFLGVRILI